MRYDFSVYHFHGRCQHNLKPYWPFIWVNRFFDSVICETSTFSMEPCEICWYVWVRKRSGWIDELWLHQAEIWLLQAVKGTLDPSNITTYISSHRILTNLVGFYINSESYGANSSTHYRCVGPVAEPKVLTSQRLPLGDSPRWSTNENMVTCHTVTSPYGTNVGCHVDNIFNTKNMPHTSSHLQYKHVLTL